MVLSPLSAPSPFLRTSDISQGSLKTPSSSQPFDISSSEDDTTDSRVSSKASSPQPKRPRKTTTHFPAKRKSKTKHDRQDASHDICDACNAPGQVVCCEACPRVFHFNCVEPPLDSNDVDSEEEWYCNACRHAHDHPNQPKLPASAANVAGFFKYAVSTLEAANPVAFCLPESIRTYFVGVSTARSGAYVDATMVRSSKPRSQPLDDLGYYPTKDKNHQYVFCYWCHKSSYKKAMIACDFCPLYWHMDCLDPSITSAPISTKKWMCPCHKQPLDIRRRVPRDWSGRVPPSTVPYPSPFFVQQPPDNEPTTSAHMAQMPLAKRSRVSVLEDAEDLLSNPLKNVSTSYRFQHMDTIFQSTP
ncbi:hypothetical protein DM01DRAFT_1035569 [Hesseltinella vesiculosa]|uniref:PHD-type domain-containing protein n=1 Tax=Hesseltinella vesiculosa TaxID=101127 RepID=A0A1X2GIB6_9FUNG|nr:hypothetical protein DM01DRAFT_1035569 [Hesseltinella vesiculosa]